jgi:pimeloyl-ACP methyl ester carboxylesterase
MPAAGETSHGDGTALTDVMPSSSRLARHTITVGDGHRVGVAVCGTGLPVVLVHGFTAEGILYAQTLSRLVGMGFKVVAIDVAGHGATAGLPTGGAGLSDYADLLGRVLDRLGIPRAVLVGHSLGGRLVVQLTAQEPDRAVAMVLIDAAVGETWDRLVRVSRVAPPVLAGLGGLLLFDAATTLPLLRDRAQAVKLSKLMAPTVAGHVLRPWRMVGPVVSLIRSGDSRPLLETVAQQDVPLVVIHGDRDVVVPYRTGQDTARLTGAWLVTVHGGTHSWLLKDPETLPAIVAELLQGPFADPRRQVLTDAGLDPDATPDEVEAAFLPPDALVRQLTPSNQDDAGSADGDCDGEVDSTDLADSAADMSAPSSSSKVPRYRWTLTRPSGGDDNMTAAAADI